ncbi:MAG: hypothetical protein WC763_07265 [Candidatus Paceibacterota bacterium]|jgi:hypothetical protein
MITPEAQFLFVIDTADYAGNFERELCAYITGTIGDCGVGEDMAQIYDKEVGVDSFTNPFEDIILSEPDEQGVCRPVTIYPAPNGDMNSVAILFEYRPSGEQIALMKERTYRFAALPEHDYGQRPLSPRISRILGFRLIEQTIKRDLREELV